MWKDPTGDPAPGLLTISALDKKRCRRSGASVSSEAADIPQNTSLYSWESPNWHRP